MKKREIRKKIKENIEHLFPSFSKERLFVYLVAIFLIGIMFLLSIEDANYYKASLITAEEKNILIESAYAKLDAPYILGADSPPTDPEAYDCSSLMIEVFKEIDIQLPRRSADQAIYGKEVTLEEVMEGDLLFFDTAGAGEISHVGLVTKKDKDGKIWMVHANSLTEKVMEEAVTGKYWRDTFKRAMRLNSLTKTKRYIASAENQETNIKSLPPSELADPRVEEKIIENQKITEQVEIEKTEISKSQFATTFADIEESYPYKEAIYTLKERNIINGTSDQTFEPYRALTRAELLKIAFNANKTSQVGTKTNLYDVKGHWVEKYVNTAVGNGFIKGYEDNTFRPDQPVTRDEGAKIILEISRTIKRFDANENFSDLNKEDWVYQYASIIKNKNLLPLSGNSFEPKKLLTRGEAAELIYKIGLL